MAPRVGVWKSLPVHAPTQPVAPAGQTTVLAEIPAGLQPGQQFQVQAPGGQLLTVAVPAGMGYPQQIQVAVPAAAPPTRGGGGL